MHAFAHIQIFIYTYFYVEKTVCKSLKLINHLHTHTTKAKDPIKQRRNVVLSSSAYNNYYFLISNNFILKSEFKNKTTNISNVCSGFQRTIPSSDNRTLTLFQPICSQEVTETDILCSYKTIKKLPVN